MSLHICPMAQYIGVVKIPHSQGNILMHHEASMLHPIFQIIVYILHQTETKRIFCFYVSFGSFVLLLMRLLEVYMRASFYVTYAK